MTGIEAPRPLNLGEILDRTVQLYRDRFLVYLGIAIIPTGVLLVLGGGIFLALVWIGSRPGTAAAPINSATATAIGVLVLVLISLPVLAVMLGVSSLSAAAMNHAAAGALAGSRPTIRGSFAESWRRGWQYVWLYFLQSLIVWGAPLIVWFGALMVLTLIVAGVGRGASPQSAGALVGLMTLFGLMAFAGYALWMLLCVGLAFPGCVVEKIGAWKAVRRSFRLSKGTRGRIFVLYLLGYVLGLIASMVAFVILVIVIALIPALNSPQHAQAMGMAMIFLIYGSSFAVQAFTKPVYTIALMLFYYDQRIRNEGFDIDWMMERAGLVAVAGAANGELLAAANGESKTGVNGEPRSASGVAPTPTATDEPIAVPVQIESAHSGETLGTAHLQVATETPEAIEATGAAKASQPENERQ
jgi:hypothetical protein